MPGRGSNRLPMITSGTPWGSTLDGRQKTAQRHNAFNSKFRFEIEEDHWVTSKIGSGSVTYASANRNVLVATTTADGDRAILQTRRYFTVHPNQTVNLFGSMRFGAGLTNVTQRFGLMDNDNGVFWAYIGTTPSIGYRKNGTDATPVAQGDWNIDKMDGNGPSGETLDFTKLQKLNIEHLGGGVAPVRWGVVINGETVFVHQLNAGNIDIIPSVSAMDLPIRVEVQNEGEASDSTSLTFGACDLSVDGESIPNEKIHAIHHGPLGVSTKRPVMSIKPRLSYLGKTVRKTIKPKDITILSLTKPSLYEILLFHAGDGTLSAASFTASHDDSLTMYDMSATGAHGGHMIGAGYIASARGARQAGSEGIDSALAYLSVNACGTTSDILVINCSGIGGEADIYTAIEFYDGE